MENLIQIDRVANEVLDRLKLSPQTWLPIICSEVDRNKEFRDSAGHTLREIEYQLGEVENNHSTQLKNLTQQTNILKMDLDLIKNEFNQDTMNQFEKSITNIDEIRHDIEKLNTVVQKCATV